ncbi:hypothetical protein SSX86_027758 [Deinandra increscens subsp. villosa]|uniref:Protein decapping 5 n=1 Tax=Deinandra increscens subsp. villosa TaxID=3103831 RepID=A0AAP0GJR2_9ASTR
MAVDGSRSSTSSADSYIGSLISLTSKSEIRYEGILYNINTEESSIGLRNVRSFGSEGRKKDGPQIMPSDKVYEYILFRGSDIKDLQVKTSTPAPPVQPTQPINNDPAIIQSHYPRPAPTSSNLPAAATGNPQVGHNGPTFQGGMPLYQPDGTMASWGPSPPPPNVNTSGLAMPPMYWPGFYAPPNGLPPQQSLFRPPPMQYPSFAPSFSGGPPNLSDYPTSAANFTTSTSLLSSTLPSGLPPVPPLLSSNEPLPNLFQTKIPNSVGPTALPPVSLSTTATISPDVNAIRPVSNKSNGLSGASPPPSLITPGQLLQSGGLVVQKDVEPAAPAPAPAPKAAPLSAPAPALAPVAKATPFSAPAPEPAPVAKAAPLSAPAPAPRPAPASEPSAPVSDPTETQPPILPLPSQTGNPPKTNGDPYQNRNSYRGRERGRGSGVSRPVIKFTEEFDFTAMNEKFNKDEVWGSLGKSKKSNSKEGDGNASDEDEFEDEYNASAALPKIDVKPVYSKDDFFDTLSCNSNDNRSNNGRTRFSEQMKLDTETFGEFPRYRGGGRGGRGPNRGGRFRGGGYHGRGYGYVNRARGGRNPARDY